VFVADNPSATLHKVSELYDRIAFAGVGKYSEFENLRIAGVRMADLRGYSYGREDVTAKAVANAYSQVLSNIFTQEMKPYEVEILVAQVGERQEENELFHILYDGSVSDEEGVLAMGGESEPLSATLKETYRQGLDLAEAIRLTTAPMTSAAALEPERMEAAVLDRTRKGRRKFRRLTDEEVGAILKR
jgi:proteasome alpha subunit